MKNLKLKSFLFALVAIAFLTTFSACKKKSDDPSDPSSGGYPKTVDVEYRVTLLSGVITTVDLEYIAPEPNNPNSDYVSYRFDKVALPVSIKFKKKVKQLESLYIDAKNSNSTYPSKSIQVDILVNGKVVSSYKQETNNGYLRMDAGYTFE